MAARRDDGPDGSPLDGLGGPRRGSHRTSGALHSLLTSLAAVVAVVVLLGGLYLAFGRGTGANDGATGTTDSSSAPAVGTTSEGSPTPTSSPSASSTATPSPTPTATPTPTPTATPTGTPAADGGAGGGAESPGAGDENGLRDLPVVVLNQSATAGTAGRTASALRASGWTVASVGNFHGAVPSTTVYYPDGALAAAQELAAELPGPDRVRPAFSGISTTKLTVILV